VQRLEEADAVHTSSRHLHTMIPWSGSTSRGTLKVFVRQESAFSPHVAHRVQTVKVL
jgi:hypothetical protein